MPIIGTVGRRSWKVRALNVMIHVVLISGAITMIYPMLLMVSGSLKSNLDKNEMDPIPRFFLNKERLFGKYIEAKYNEQIRDARTAHRINYFSFENVVKPSQVSDVAVSDWQEYLKNHPPKKTEYELGFCVGLGVIPKNGRLFKTFLQQEYHDDINALNKDLGTFYSTWWEILRAVENLHIRAGNMFPTPLGKKFREFKDNQPADDRNVYSLSGLFVEDILKIKYSSDIREFNKRLGLNFASYAYVNLTQGCPPPTDPLRDDWLRFVRSSVNLQFVRVRESEVPSYQKFLSERHPSIEELNRVYGSTYASFSEIPMPLVTPNQGVPYADWESYVVNAAQPESLYLVAAEFSYRDFLRDKYKTVDALNKAYELGYTDFSEVELTEGMPQDNCFVSDDWLAFIRNSVPYEQIGLANNASADFLAFLATLYDAPEKGQQIDLAKLNEAYGTHYASPLDIIMPQPTYTIEGREEQDWKRFLLEVVSPIYYQIDPENLATGWRDFLKQRYASIDKLNERWGETRSDFLQVAPPYIEADWKSFLEHKNQILWEFVTRNFKMVFEYLVMHGRGFWNTIIYCLLTVVTHLLVNPIAAYALSRYKLPSTYKILLFCMLTMTFPPIVLGIPNFLLLKQLGLLNTFAALILPSMANGYSIFLLKGFFDSLPNELYEAATIDGAGEFTMFWQITMALSKPILAVIALQGFNAAYANFMFALITCQDEKMWTLMVWLYQLQQMASQPVVFASLVLAGVPTLLLFIFCQNIILRGIVVPVEK